MANDTPDFVQVQLTAAGKALAGAHPLSISNGRRSFSFTSASAVKVELSYEWKAFLSKQVTNDGQALFEIVPAPSATQAPAAPAQSAAAKPATQA